IDSQVAAIETACGQLAETDPRIALRAAFEIIRGEIEAFRDEDARAPAPEAAVPPAATAGAGAAVVAFPSPLASAVHEIAEAPAIADEPAGMAEIEAALRQTRVSCRDTPQT